MSIVTDSTLRAMLEQLHAALSDDDGKGARVWPALTADNFAEVQVGDFFNHSRYRFAVLFKTSSKIVGVGIYPSGNLEATRYEVNLVGGVLQTPVMTKLASLADLDDLKRGEYTSLTADNFSKVQPGDKVGNGIVIYKTSTNCTVYTGYQKLVQYELSGGVVTPFEMTVPEKGEVAALKTAVNGKWDKPVIYGDANPITSANFDSVKPGDYYYGTMCVKGANGGNELHFAGGGAYRKEIRQSDGTIKSEYGVSATTAQLNVKADKSELVAIEDLDTMLGATLAEVIRYCTASQGTSNRFTVTSNGLNIGVLDIFSDNMRHLVTQVLETHCLLENGKITTNHVDNKIFRYYRSYNINSTNLPDVARGAWSDWKECQPLAGENVRFQKVFTDTATTSIFNAEVGDVVSGASEALSGIVLYCDGYNTLKMYTGQGIKVASRSGTKVTWSSQG